jgi:Flp pilus assembly protein TadG
MTISGFVLPQVSQSNRLKQKGVHNSMLCNSKINALSRGHLSTHSRSGFIAVLTALMLVFLMAMVAFAVDIGYLCVVKSQTQAVADAAALAGARGLSTSTAQVQANAIACAKLNTANGQAVTLTDSNIVVGTWSTSTSTFTASATNANACQVTVPLTATNGNPVSLFFAKALGDSSANVTSSAVAGGGRCDVVIVLDRSSSFQEDIAEAVTGIQDILTYMNTYTPSSYLGVVTFDGVSYINAAMQQVGANYSTLQSDIAAIVDCADGGPACSGSDLAAGMAGGIALFSSSGYSPPSGTRQALLFVSDGAANVTSQCLNSKLSDTQDNTLAATEAAAAYSSKGISVYSLLYYHGSDSSVDTNAMAALIQGTGTFLQEVTPSLLPSDLSTMFTSNLGTQILK